MKHVYVVVGKSESGDDYGPFVFAAKPTEKQKRELIRKECDWAEDDGPGDYGSYTFLQENKVAVR